MNGSFVYAVSAGACAGLALGLLFGLSLAGGFLLLLAGITFLILGRMRPRALIAAACCAAAALGCARAAVFLHAVAQETLAENAGKTVVVSGTVAGDPERRETALYTTLDISSINGSPGSGRLLALMPRDAPLFYGERVSVRGALETPQPFASNGGRQFDYPGYLRVRGISALMRHSALLSATPGGWSLYEPLFSLKHAFENSLERALPEPESSLLEGVLLGERRGLSQEVNNAFIQSGLVHVVVLSGYNISIVSEGVLRALSFLPRAAGFGVGGITIVLFALMVGGGAATIRACIMALIAIAARYLHRSTIALRSLALAAAGMALWNPPALLGDPSFILSVLATFGLITLSPWVEARLPRFLARFPSVRSIAASTISVQVFVLPALLYFTGVLSFLALPANVLALPVVPLAMLSGFTTGVLGFIHPLLAVAPALLTEALLRWMLFIAAGLSSLPFSAAAVSAFPAWVAALCYVPLGYFAVRSYRKTKIA